MSEEIFYFIKDKLTYNFDVKKFSENGVENFIENKTIIFNKIKYDVQFHICSEYFFAFQQILNQDDTNLIEINKKIFYNMKQIYYDYNILNDDIYTHIKKFIDNTNDKFYYVYKLHCFNNGYWYLIINITCNLLSDDYINCKKDNDDDEGDEEDSYISKDDSIFDDKMTCDLKEWIIELIKENKKLEKKNIMLIEENKELKKLIDK